MSRYYIGVDLGGTNVKIGCFDENLTLVCKTSVPTEAEMGPEFVVERIVEGSKSLLDQNGLSVDDISAIGIGTPGPADYKAGIVIKSTNMPKFQDTPLRDMISAGLGSKPAILENDANVACWGEFSMGAGKGQTDLIFMTLGTGIGGGVVCNGELVQGVGGNAAELGHVIIYPGGRACNCGQRGCVEAYGSANSTAGRAMEALQADLSSESTLKAVLDKHGEVTSKDVFQHAENGDPLALEIVDGTAEALAIMCINMLHTSEPSSVVFSGGMIAAGDFLLSKIRHFFDEHIWTLKKENIKICYATLGEDTGIIGAGSLACHALKTGQIG